MLGKSAIVAFAATTRPEEAKAFYTGTLGLALLEDTPFALVFNAGGTALRVQKVPAFTPLPFTLLGWNVADIGATVQALAAQGILFERYGFLQQQDNGIWTAPDGTQVAWFKDPDGNTLSLTQGLPGD